MTTRTELNALLAAYENYIGTGNMKQAGRTLPKIIHALVTFVEERTPDHIEAEPELAAPAAPPPCAPCDVSIPNNPSLIEAFKTGVEHAIEHAAEIVHEAEAAVEALVVPKEETEEETPAEKSEEETPPAADPAAEKPADETEAETPSSETPPVEEATAPAPKTPKKPKATD